MIDMMQAFAARKIVEAHGERWLVCYKVPGIEGDELYLACRESDTFPAQVQLIRVERKVAP